MPGPPPTKYNDTVIRLAEEYYQECLSIPNQMPTVEELSRRLDIDDDTLVEWSKQEDKQVLSATYKKVKQLQRQRLQSMGLFNRVNPTMAIFLLKTNHGFVDVSRQEHSGRDGGPIETSTMTYMPKQLEGNYFDQSADEKA